MVFFPTWSEIPHSTSNSKNALQKTTGISEYVIPVSLKKRTVYAELMVDSQEPSSIHQLQPSNPARIEAEAFCEHVFKKVMQT